MPMHLKNAGTWKELKPHVKVGGSWQPIQNGYIKVAGTWETFYQFGITRTVTVANAAPFYGFSTPGGYGSIDDSSLNGQTIEIVDNEDDIVDTFRVRISGTLPQDWFSSIEIPSESTSLFTQFATHVQSGGSTTWAWTDNVWLFTTGDKDVIFKGL